jgi:hypothetical protein
MCREGLQGCPVAHEASDCAGQQLAPPAGPQQQLLLQGVQGATGQEVILQAAAAAAATTAAERGRQAVTERQLSTSLLYAGAAEKSD